MIANGDILGAITIIGVQHVLLRRGRRSRTSAVKSLTAGTSARGRSPHSHAVEEDPLSATEGTQRAIAAGLSFIRLVRTFGVTCRAEGVAQISAGGLRE
jgi:hypothetical protein